MPSHAEQLRQVFIHARKKAKLSQEELAVELGTGRSTIAKLENGTMSLSWHWIERLSDYFKIPIEIKTSAGEEGEQAIDPSILKGILTYMLKPPTDIPNMSPALLAERLVYAAKLFTRKGIREAAAIAERLPDILKSP